MGVDIKSRGMNEVCRKRDGFAGKLREGVEKGQGLENESGGNGIGVEERKGKFDGGVKKGERVVEKGCEGSKKGGGVLENGLGVSKNGEVVLGKG